MRQRVRILALLAPSCLVLACGLTSCSRESSNARDFESARTASITPGEALPVAADPILRIVDADGREVASLDIDGIEALGTVRATVDDRWFDRELPVEGVWLRDLLRSVGSPDASTVRLHALDDYEIDLRIDDFDHHDVLLATRADGERIPVEDGGPTRLVFLDAAGGDADGSYWIWNIDAIFLL